MKKKITWNNIKDFLAGNYRYYYDKNIGYPKYMQEQFIYRLEQCKTSCVPFEKCEVCECPPKKKVYVTKSCNKGKKFPDLMEEGEWEQFKRNNNIVIDEQLIQSKKENN